MNVMQKIRSTRASPNSAAAIGSLPSCTSTSGSKGTPTVKWSLSLPAMSRSRKMAHTLCYTSHLYPLADLKDVRIGASFSNGPSEMLDDTWDINWFQ